MGDEGSVGQCTRDPAQNWAHEYTAGLRVLVDRALPCNFAHQYRRTCLRALGDDFTVVASEKQMEWIGEEMTKRHELDVNVLGPSAGQEEEVRVLNPSFAVIEPGWSTSMISDMPRDQL